MDIETIRRIVAQSGYRLTAHASIEATKDGISPADIRYVLLQGKIIEQYPERNYRDIESCLVYAKLPSRLDVHIVVDVIATRAVVVVTAYVPDRDQWVASQKRKRPSGKKR
jgi:hypothetical protein